LQRAQALNPLNTDHTANLARLYSLWSTYSDDAEVRRQRGEKSAQYFERATTLSPNSARLWDEWALLYLNVLQEPDAAYERLSHALEIDPYYDWTYGLLGDYYSRKASAIPEDQAGQREEILIQATDYYSKALSTPGADPQMRYQYALALGNAQTNLGQIDQAITTYVKAVDLAPAGSEKWRIEENIARLYVQLGDVRGALEHAQNALSLAPDDQKERLQQLVAQLSTALPTP
jgi:tetratricopeptide (TPR) repeat protein